MKTVIIGGVAAGMSAAAKLKRLDRSNHVTVLEKGQETSYGACGLPYYISGVNPDEDLLRIRSPKEFEDSGVDLRLRCEAMGVDTVSKFVRCKDLATGKTYDEHYDHLVVATGADPISPPWHDGSLANVFTLKTIGDANRIKAAAAAGAKRAVVVGGGYIGLEMVECFLHLGLDVDLIEMADRVLPSFDEEFSGILEEHLASKGVNIHTGEAVTALEGDRAVHAVATGNGRYAADLVLVAAGVRPNTAFLAGSGLELAPNGAVRIDRRMLTSAPGVWAAGDCACVWHRVLQKEAYLPLATNANKQGRYTAENIMGANRAYEAALGTAVMKVCDLEIGRTGIGESEAKRNGLECVSAYTEGMDRAPYYPGGNPIAVKLVCRKGCGTVVGAQLAGHSGVALRTNVMAACITAGMTARQVGGLDFGYAPPYAMPWDVLHAAANSIKEG